MEGSVSICLSCLSIGCPSAPAPDVADPSLSPSHYPTDARRRNRFFGGEFAFESRWRNFGVMLVFIGLCQLAFWAALRYRRFEKR